VTGRDTLIHSESNAKGRTRTRMSILTLLVSVTVACTDARPGEVGPEAGTPLALSAQGFGLSALGDSIESVTDKLTARWGPLIDSREFKCESFATSKILTWDGVKLVFNGSGLSGYLLGPKPKDAISPAGKDLAVASTTEGLKLGGQVKEARDMYRSRFVLLEATLGPEWYVEGDYPLLRGFASGLTESDAITHIGAGDICAVR